MFQESDFVVWNEAVGEITTIHAGTIYVDFYTRNSASDMLRHCLEFALDGTSKLNPKLPPLAKADSAQVHFFNVQEKHFVESSDEFRYSIAN